MADDLRSGGFVLEVPGQASQPVSPQRSASAKTHDWPAGTTIISADSHMLETDCWIDRFPEHLKDRAPRMEFRDGGWHFTIGGKPMMRPHDIVPLCEAMECHPGLTSLEARAGLGAGSVDADLAGPQHLLDLALRQLRAAFDPAIKTRAGFLVGDRFGDDLATHAKARFAIQSPSPSAATLRTTERTA